MSDVNEELVRRYFERRGYLVRTNVQYQTRRGQWSEIDLCVLHPRSNDAAAVEVKGWRQPVVTLADFHDQWGVFNFVQPEALQAATDALGRDGFRRILVLPRVHERFVEQVTNLVNEHQVVILTWPDILRFLIESTTIDRPATNESENVIRALKAHADGVIFGSQLGVGP